MFLISLCTQNMNKTSIVGPKPFLNIQIFLKFKASLLKFKRTHNIETLCFINFVSEMFLIAIK